MRFLSILFALVLILLAGTLILIYSGTYDVAATTEHTGFTHWVLDTAMERSVAARAGDVPVPDDLDSRARIEAGASHYAATCQTCHGAPGAEPAELAEGLNPKAPDLADEAEEWSPAELFWITKHGIRMTGMPAFGPTHADEDLWSMVAFVRALPEMSADEYARLEEEAGEHRHAGGGHADGEPSAEEGTPPEREASEGDPEHEDDHEHDEEADDGDSGGPDDG